MGVPVPLKPVPAPVAATGCPVCAVSLEGGADTAPEALARCRRCDTLHHRRCFEYNLRCATFACGGRAFVPVDAAPDGGRGEVVRVERGLSPAWIALASVLWSLSIPAGLAFLVRDPASLGAYLIAAITAWVIALAGVRVEHELDPSTRSVTRRTRLLGREVSRAVIGCERLAGLVLDRPTSGMPSVHLREHDGTRHLLRYLQVHEVAEALAETERAAEVLELPAELPRALPAA